MNDLVWYSILMLVSVFFGAVSQVLLKKEALRPHARPIDEYLNVRVISAYSIFLVTAFMTMYAYKVVPLSLGPILEATSYIYIAFFGVMLFKERWSPLKTAGLILILAGIAIYTFLG